MKTPLLVALGLIIGLAAAFGGNQAVVRAASIGWLWGGTPSADGAYQGVGWIDAGGVVVPATDGNLSGYAWTPYYGWLSFNQSDLVGCPYATCAAYRQGNTIQGWARFLSLENTPGMTGWVSLAHLGEGSKGGLYGIGTINPYAWSGDLGWIDLSGLDLSAAPTVHIQFQ